MIFLLKFPILTPLEEYQVANKAQQQGLDEHMYRVLVEQGHPPIHVRFSEISCAFVFREVLQKCLVAFVDVTEVVAEGLAKGVGHGVFMGIGFYEYTGMFGECECL